MSCWWKSNEDTQVLILWYPLGTTERRGSIISKKLDYYRDRPRGTLGETEFSCAPSPRSTRELRSVRKKGLDGVKSDA